MAYAVRDLSRFNTKSSEDHMTALPRAMSYAVNSPKRGVTLAPQGEWIGDPAYEFQLTGMADASYQPYEDAAVSVGGHAVFLNNAPIVEKSKIQQATTLSVTEAEVISGTDFAQDMTFAMRVLESIGLRVKKPMVLHIDNKGDVDDANNWSTDGRLRHAVIRLSFFGNSKRLVFYRCNGAARRIRQRICLRKIYQLHCSIATQQTFVGMMITVEVEGNVREHCNNSIPKPRNDDVSIDDVRKRLRMQRKISKQPKQNKTESEFI
jgi:hypothetical protein